jgi:hypothetical protein
MLGRYSKNPVFNQPGRTIYPQHQGCIGVAWRDGHACVSDLPDPTTALDEYCSRQVNDWHLDQETARGLEMKSRSYAAYAIEDLRGLGTVAVIVFESTRTNVLNCEGLRATVQGPEIRRLVRFLETQPVLPNPTYALREGY